MGVNILVAHGGGPTAVINTSLQGVVEAARESGKVDKIYAARFGAEGILKGDLIDLTDVPASTITKLSHTPASAIGSCRRKLTDADYPTVIETLKKFNMPNMLPNYVMGYTLFDETADVEALIREYYEAAYPRQPRTALNHMERLSRLSSCDYVNGKGPRVRPDIAGRMAEIAKSCQEMLERTDIPDSGLW